MVDRDSAHHAEDEVKIMFFRSKKKKERSFPGFDDFDAEAYLAQNPDVAAAKVDPLEHYVEYGKAEGRAYPRRQRDTEVDLQYAKVIGSGYFDPEWYVTTHADVRSGGLAPLRHFMEHGVWEGRDPGPRFSTSWYLEQYPDIRGMNPLLHYLDHGMREGRSPAPPKGLLRTAEAVFASIEDLEPALYGNERFRFFKGVPLLDGRPRGNAVKAALAPLFATVPATATHLVCVPWCIHSGSDVVVANIVRTAVERLGLAAVALIIIDFDKIEGSDWLPPGLTIVNFAARTQRLSQADKLLALETFIKVVAPQKVLNVNSNLTWSLMRDRGGVLANYARLYACTFCRDYDRRNRAAGYADTHFRDAVPHLSGVYLDNKTFKNELVTQYGLVPADAGKLVVLRQPVRIHPPRREDRAHGPRSRLRIFWAARFVRQKNYELLARIVNSSPKHFSFSIWGVGSEEDSAEFRKLLGTGVNCELCGEFSSFEELPLADYDVFLYTSLWDGIPNVLLEAAACGFPIVTPDVGGIGELVDTECGWLVSDLRDPTPYVAALEEIERDPIAAKAKGAALARRVAIDHARETFDAAISANGQFLGDGE